jgi:glycosyltransferase involved in cell wall biosynthesis
VELAVVILNWNAAPDTVRCVQALSLWRKVRPIIWVVDNGSTDGSADIIAGECPHIHLIRNSTNLGFAGGNNRGIEAALSAGNWPVLLLNIGEGRGNRCCYPGDERIGEEQKMPGEEILAAYKGQGVGPERGFRFLKDPLVLCRQPLFEEPAAGYGAGDGG